MNVKTISEAWWQTLNFLYDYHYVTEIDRGSYEKAEKRYQLQRLWGVIEFPLYDMIPQVPFGVPQPTTRDYIEEYFRTKIIGTVKDENEEYTYGERIVEQLPAVIEMLQKTPLTNQAVIEVGKPEDILLPDPPCLRVITFKNIPDKEQKRYRLNVGVFFRSWELYAGFPTNLGGMALLMEYVAGFLENTSVGNLMFASDGAHVYSYSWEHVKQILHKTNDVYM